MSDNGRSSVIAPELVQELRETARRRTSVRELTATIQSRLGCNGDVVIPVLAGFVEAFHLPLLKALPIREWLGTDNDAEIDALILPEIAKAREQWAHEPPTEPAARY